MTSSAIISGFPSNSSIVPVMYTLSPCCSCVRFSFLNRTTVIVFGCDTESIATFSFSVIFSIVPLIFTSLSMSAVVIFSMVFSSTFMFSDRKYRVMTPIIADIIAIFSSVVSFINLVSLLFY